MQLDEVIMGKHVKIIKKSGESALVEWGDNGGLHRAYIPETRISADGFVDKTVLDYAVPYGLPWESIIQFNASPDEFANQLRSHGIWNKEDAEKNPARVQGIIQSVYGVDFANFMKLINEFVNKKNLEE